MSSLVDPLFWKDKRVLITGHTGFKGSWLALWLSHMGAHVSGFARPPVSTPNLFTLSGLDERISDGLGELQNRADVRAVVRYSRPDIVLHLAAQPLVLASVREPVETFASNVMGTVHLLDALRDSPNLQAVLIVTTDKVYRNTGDMTPFKETDPLGGHDPYSASKAATELVAATFAANYFDVLGIPVATARGGNVIGGGDFSDERLVPDIYRAVADKTELILRHPYATRPWQHVLDCLSGYLTYVQQLCTRGDLPRAINFGPSADAPVTVAAMANAMLEAMGQRAQWRQAQAEVSVEMQALTLDCRLAEEALGWRNRLPGMRAVQATADWYLAFRKDDDMRAYTLKAIEDYLKPS